MDKAALINISLGIISGVLTTILLTGGRYAYNRYVFYHRHSFLYESLKNYQVIQIILPSIHVESFGFDNNAAHMSHNSPPNVLFMPFNESFAISKIVLSMNKLFVKKDVKLIYPSQYDDSMPAISIGGPSVNSFSKKILAKDFPTFQINYPEATEARIKGLTFTTEQENTTRIVTKDYGFFFSTTSKSKAPCFIACGILAFGTQVAIEKMLHLKATSGIGKSFIAKKARVFCVEADIEGFDANVGNSTTVI